MDFGVGSAREGAAHERFGERLPGSDPPGPKTESPPAAVVGLVGVWTSGGGGGEILAPPNFFIRWAVGLLTVLQEEAC